MSVDERFKRGLELFNDEKFFECHEVIEDLWLGTKGKYRDLYKGVIQAAVSLYHLKRGNMAGARALLGTSTRYLAKYRSHALGLNVEKLINDLNLCFAEAESSKSKRKNLLPKALVPKLAVHK